MSIEQHYPKPRHRHLEKSKRADSTQPVSEPEVSTPPDRNTTISVSSQVFSNAEPSGQALPESIEICCPVCSYSSLSQDETGQTSCEECDYVEAGEFDY
jgi:hypothetical protein